MKVLKTYREFIEADNYVSPIFLKDYFRIAGEDWRNMHDIVVDLDEIVDWIKIKKGYLKKLLVENYKEGFDYTITTTPATRGKGKKEKIKISRYCLKELGLGLQPNKMSFLKNKPNMTRKEIRENEARIKIIRDFKRYFIRLEYLWQLYIDYRMRTLEDNEKLYQADRRSKQRQWKDGLGKIYFYPAYNQPVILVDNEGEEILKLGYSDGLLTERFSTYSSAMALKIEPLFEIEVDHSKTIERCIKSLLVDFGYNLDKEIYKINVALLKRIVYGCVELVYSINDWLSENEEKWDAEIEKMNHILESDQVMIIFQCNTDAKIEPESSEDPYAVLDDQ